MSYTAAVHDEWAKLSQEYGYSSESPATMIPAFIFALYLNLEQTGSDILDVLDDFVSGGGNDGGITE